MITASHLFEDFGGIPKPKSKAPSFRIEEVEDQKLESFERRKRLVNATSFGSASLPKGMLAANESCHSCGMLSNILVAVGPGQIAFTLIFLALKSIANALVKPKRAAFEVQ